MLKYFLLFCLVASINGWAGDITLPSSLDTSVAFEETGDVLKLRGAGIYKYYGQDYYLGAFYTLNTLKDPKAVLEDNGSQRMVFYFIKPVSHFRQQLQVDINANNSPDLLEREQLNIGQFFDYLSDSYQKGDTIILDFIPNVGMKVLVNGTYKGMIKGNQFYNLVLKIWMGRQPPSKKFQKDLFYLPKGIHI